jgi:hypothetical protein
MARSQPRQTVHLIPISKLTRGKWTGSVAQAVECFASSKPWVGIFLLIYPSTPHLDLLLEGLYPFQYPPGMTYQLQQGLRKYSLSHLKSFLSWFSYSFLFFFFTQSWGLNSGPCTC